VSYLDDEKSVANAKPVELYKFDGTYASYYYTSGPKIITYDGHDYIPSAIERSEVKAGTHEDDGLDITIKLPVAETVVQDYAFTTSPPKLKLTIYRQEPGGTIVYWTGPVNNMSVDEDGRAAVRCPSFLGAALVGNIPDVHYQTPCNHTLYDGRCGVDYAANSNVTAVTAISADGKTITVGSIAALDGKLIGGELALGTGERRMIVSQVGTAITVNFPFARITVGGAATVAAGCDYAYSGDCKNKFDNQLRFGGFMFIPPINPFADGIEPAADGVADTSCVFTHPPPSGEWARVTLRLDEGPAHGGIADISVPEGFPFCSIGFRRGGVDLFAIANADNFYTYVYGPGGVQAWEMTCHVYKPEAAAYHGETGYATDPFADGPPDELAITIQFSSTTPAGPGLMSVKFQRHGETAIQTVDLAGPPAGAAYVGGPYYRIERLWPIVYTAGVP
jgi:hypothetical protein